MLTKGQAFRLGYLTATIGIYFNLVELLGQATQGASVSLAERVQQHVDSLQTQQDAVIANVRRVEALLAITGLAAGEPPRVPTEYYAWVDRIAEAFERAFRESRLELTTFRLLGFWIGDALVTLNLGVYVEDLAAFNPKNPWLQEQESALAGEQERIGNRLAQVQGVPLLDEKGQQALTELVALYSGAPRIGSVADHRSAAATLQNLLRECSELRGRVEESLREAGNKEL